MSVRKISLTRGSAARKALVSATVAVAVSIGSLLTVPAATAAPASSAGQPAGNGPSACTRALPIGSSNFVVDFGGEPFNVQVHVPSAPSHKQLPLVLDLHGSDSNAASQSYVSGLAEIADAEGFIVATPEGNIPFAADGPSGATWGWNVPGVPLTLGNLPSPDARDDVAFLRAVVKQIDGAACVDGRRVYATGYSGGGRMASALACEASDVFAAIAPVAGLRAGRSAAPDYLVPAPGTCEPTHPVAVVTFHGTADPVNPYQGNTDPRWGYSTQAAAQEWAHLNDCRVGPVVTQYSPDVKQYTWSKCSKQADVVLYEVANGGHTWPGSAVPFEAYGAGYSTPEINASQTMWDFFKSHQRRG
ncbi:extracellular catalytic domain type 1 short-chain-length polyhydroxyalkanoate depolymerase [Paenarthrobacter sp. 2TAF44]